MTNGRLRATVSFLLGCTSDVRAGSLPVGDPELDGHRRAARPRRLACPFGASRRRRSSRHGAAARREMASLAMDTQPPAERPGRHLQTKNPGFERVPGFFVFRYQRTLRAMRSIGRALIAIALLPATVLAGTNRGEDNLGPLPDEGPSYFGVVLDAAGKRVDDARVSAADRDGP